MAIGFVVYFVTRLYHLPLTHTKTLLFTHQCLVVPYNSSQGVQPGLADHGSTFGGLISFVSCHRRLEKPLLPRWKSDSTDTSCPQFFSSSPPVPGLRPLCQLCIAVIKDRAIYLRRDLFQPVVPMIPGS